MTAPSQDLIVLGMLARRALHGYELRQLIERWLGEIAQITPGTLYYTLKKLERRGLIRSAAERQGNRPERRVYSITAAGRRVFRELLKDSLFQDERPYYVFDVGLYFADHLEPGVLDEAVRTKLDRLTAIKTRIETLERDNPGPWPMHFEALRQKGRLLTDAFERWYHMLTEISQRRERSKKPTRTKRTRRTPREVHAPV